MVSMGLYTKSIDLLQEEGEGSEAGVYNIDGSNYAI